MNKWGSVNKVGGGGGGGSERKTKMSPSIKHSRVINIKKPNTFIILH